LVIDGLLSPDCVVSKQQPKFCLDKATCKKFDEMGWHYISMKILLKGDEGGALPRFQKILTEDGSKTLLDYHNPHFSYTVENGSGATDHHSYYKTKSLTKYLQAIPFLLLRVISG
jgi:hypothetical protein